MAKTPYILLIVTVCLSTLLNVAALRKGHDWADDSAIYIAQARSLIEGTTAELFAQNRYAMSHSTFAIGPDLVPWGLPLILSPVYALFGLNFLAMKLLGIVFFELSIVVLFFMFLRKFDTSLIFLAIAFFAFHPFVLFVNDHINSDIPYIFFSLLALYSIEQIVIRQKFSNYRLIGPISIGFLIFISYSIRFIGIIILPLLLITQIASAFHNYRGQFLKYSFNDKSFFLPYLTFAFCELLIYLSLPYAFSTQASMIPSPSLSTTRELIKYYINITAEFYGSYYPMIIYGTTLPFISLGLYKSFTTSYLYILYPILTLAILISVPFVQGIRYLLPIFPFILYFLCVGLQNSPSEFSLALKSLTYRLKPSYLYMAIIVCLLTSSSVQDVYANLKRGRIIEGPFTENGQKMLSFIADHTEKNDIIIFFKPRFITLLTRRQSLMISNFTQLLGSNGSYVVLYKPAGSYNQIAPAGKDYAQLTERFATVYENSDFTIFRLKGEGAAP